MHKVLTNSRIFLVGGAVRDQLLGVENKEKDWLVLATTAEEMIETGFRQVGEDFPVFIHPKTGEEYALARTERKVSSGYRGFSFNTSKSITLEEDLLRRDLTINAIARDHQGKFHDPYQGKKDIDKRVLRHVSNAFVEDPLRVLRIARFMAQLSPFNFTIANETKRLMGNLVQSGELDALKPERVWKETEKALMTTKPSLFFMTLKQCGALAILYPQIDALFGIPQRKEFHPEVDCAIHTMMTLDQAAILSDNLATRFAALCHDLGKALTPKSILPSHHGHEKSGLKPLKALCQRYPVPKNLEKIASISCEFHLHMHKLTSLRAQTILKLLIKLNAFHSDVLLQQFIDVCQADYQGRLGWQNKPYPQANKLRKFAQVAKSVTFNDIKNTLDDEINGSQIGKMIHQKRLEAIKLCKNS